MKQFPLIVAALRRKPLRALLTMLGVTIAFVLFGMLQGVDSAFALTLARMKLDRLFVDSRFSQPMPLTYRDKIARVPGVTQVTAIAFMDGYYQDPKNEVLAIATTPSVWLSIRPEYNVPRDQLEAAERTRDGVIITDWLARKYGWRIGDRFVLRTGQVLHREGTDWTFVVAGVMTYQDPTQALTLFLANLEYYDEARLQDKGLVDRFLLRVADPRRNAQICRQIDELFITSGVQTRTQTEQEMGQAQMASIGDISFFTRSIIGAVFFTLMILTANTMIESVRERTPELAVLKAVGFSNTAVLLLVVMEAALLCGVAAGIGLILAAALFPLAGAYVDITTLPPVVFVWGLLAALGLAMVSALLPGWRAVRLRVVDALAR